MSTIGTKACGLGGPVYSAGAPSPTHPFWRLNRWWRRSAYIRAAEELRKFPRRMLTTILQNATQPGLSYRLPTPVEPIPYVVLLENCNRDIQVLRAENPWMTSLDREKAAEAWAKGLQFALRMSKEKR